MGREPGTFAGFAASAAALTGGVWPRCETEVGREPGKLTDLGVAALTPTGGGGGGRGWGGSGADGDQDKDRGMTIRVRLNGQPVPRNLFWPWGHPQHTVFKVSNISNTLVTR